MRHLAYRAYRATVALSKSRTFLTKIRMKLTKSALYIIAIQAGIRASQSGMSHAHAMADAADDYQTGHESVAPMHNDIDDHDTVFSSANSLVTNAQGVLIGLLLL